MYRRRCPRLRGGMFELFEHDWQCAPRGAEWPLPRHLRPLWHTITSSASLTSSTKVDYFWEVQAAFSSDSRESL